MDRMKGLREIVNKGYAPTMAQEFSWYVEAEQADEKRHDFQLYWIDFHTNERGKVWGETGYEWLEVHEVGLSYNQEGNGLFHYVGYSDYDGAVRPAWSELKSVVAFALAERYRDGVPQEWYTYSDWLAAYTLFRISPRYELHRRENWV